jgi:hypothetical protein
VVKVAGKKKTATPATDKTFKVSTTTTVSKVAGKKDKGTPATTAKFSEIVKGSKVILVAKDDEASDIKFTPAKKAKKKKKTK